MKIRDIVDALERFAPLPLQEEYDNSGLQVGLTETEVSGVFLCLDVSCAAIREAVSRGCNMIVSHHPLLFHPLKRVDDSSEAGRCVIEAVRNGVAIYSAHTNLDNVMGGVNFMIASKLGLKNVGWLVQTGDNSGSGVLGDLPSEMCEGEFLMLLKRVFAIDCIRCNQLYSKAISRVALCGGAGAFLIPKAIEAGADAFVTGEIGYHHFSDYCGNMLLVEMGHFESEQYTVDLLESIIGNEFPGLKLETADGRNSNPIRYV